LKKWLHSGGPRDVPAVRVRLLTVLLLAGCGSNAVETQLVRAHLERVERELREAPMPGLSPAQRERRAAALDALHSYLEAERFPTNRVQPTRTPIFIDEDGARCAMAALIESTGQRALVARVAREHNLAHIKELAQDAELVAWLDENGLTVDEAAHIQPSYGIPDPEWMQTIRLLALAQFGAAIGGSSEAVIAPGLRWGVRRRSEWGHSALELTLEYARSFDLGAGNTNLVSLLVSYEVEGWSSSESALYLLAGPRFSLDEDNHPGFQGGGTAGVGYRAYHFFVELSLSVLKGATTIPIRGGLTIGAVLPLSPQSL
jgi:hypothetical protein